MIDNLLGGNDDEATADESDDEEIGGLFDDPGDAGAGGGDGMLDGEEMMDGGDDLMGGDNDLMVDDGMALDDGEDAGASNGEMNNRIEELENEVDSLSSTVNTVKSENEQISESLDDVEENIRKLLEVYEMVTRGVNPFVNENELGDAFGGGGSADGDGGSMGLFGGEEPQEEASDIDDSVANADPDEFFDDDLDDGFEGGDGFDEEFEEESEDGFDGGFEDDIGDGEDAVEVDTEDGDADTGGKSFEDLKSEYETGAADQEDEAADGNADIDASITETGVETNGTTGSEPDAGTGSEGGKPYLKELPAGYVADVVVMDWLEFLVDEGGLDGAARTIAYYEAIDWISESAAESLQTYLQGFGDGVETDPEPRSWLTVSHHNTSLRFISRIDNPSMEMMAFDERGGHPRREPGADGDSSGVFPAGDDHGPRQGFGSPTTDRPELESDGGRRTYDGPGESTYEPATARRSRDAHSDENDSGEVGYGGFCWNHDGN